MTAITSNTTKTINGLEYPRMEGEELADLQQLHDHYSDQIGKHPEAHALLTNIGNIPLVVSFYSPDKVEFAPKGETITINGIEYKLRVGFEWEKHSKEWRRASYITFSRVHPLGERPTSKAYEWLSSFSDAAKVWCKTSIEPSDLAKGKAYQLESELRTRRQEIASLLKKAMDEAQAIESLEAEIERTHQAVQQA